MHLKDQSYFDGKVEVQLYVALVSLFSSPNPRIRQTAVSTIAHTLQRPRYFHNGNKTFGFREKTLFIFVFRFSFD